MNFGLNIKGPLGLTVGEPEWVYAYHRGGAGTKGQVVEFDITAARSDHVTASVNLNGGSTQPFSNVIATTETGTETPYYHIFGVLMEDIADDAMGKVCVRGRVQALRGDTATIGTALRLDTGGTLQAAANGTYAVAIALETGVDGSIGWVLFDGTKWRYVNLIA